MFRFPLRSAWRVALVLIAVACIYSRPAWAAFPTGEVSGVMGWLPDDTESIMCARGPLTIPATPNKKSEAAPLPPPVGISSQFYASNVWFRVAERRIPGRTIRYSLEAKRKFRSPKDIGMEKYEGCGVLLLQPLAGLTQAQVDKGLQEKSKKKLTVQGINVALISSGETVNNREKWEIYLAAPNPDTILIATDLGVLEHVIAQMKANSDPATARQMTTMALLGPQWPGWSYVDANSRLWMARHDVSHAVAGQEPNDIAGYEDVASNSVVLTGILSDRAKMLTAIGNIRTETNLRMVTKEVQIGTYQTRCWLDGDEEELGTLSFYLTDIFGPSIIVAPF